MEKFEDQHMKEIGGNILRGRNNKSHNNILFSRSGIKIESLSSTASKTNEMVNVISEKLNNVVDVTEEVIDRFNNLPEHASLSMLHEGIYPSVFSEMKKGMIKHEIRWIPKRDNTKLNNKK